MGYGALVAITGAIILVPCHVVKSATHSKMGPIFNEMQWLDSEIGYLDNSPSNEWPPGGHAWNMLVSIGYLKFVLK